MNATVTMTIMAWMRRRRMKASMRVMAVVHAQPASSWPPVQRMHRTRAVADEGAMIRNTRAGRKRGNTRSITRRRAPLRAQVRIARCAGDGSCTLAHGLSVSRHFHVRSASRDWASLAAL
jgi:hypothetical protein